MRKTIELALQGGGAHGALTWGVLDRLLEDERLQIEGISGTSAGAMNAVALAEGMQRAGPEGARQALQEFWRGVSDAARFSPIQRSLWDRLTGNWSLDSSTSYLLFDHLTRLFSPYDFNPLNLNPVKGGGILGQRGGVIFGQRRGAGASKKSSGRGPPRRGSEGPPRSGQRLVEVVDRCGEVVGRSGSGGLV